ncbi:MAG: hypothetical protein Q8K36_06975 [Alphaproteobacteria bacterium]|nr:hypothetical protein [Alphaproteobacteria bacterium]
MKIKDYLKKVKCPECANNDFTRFKLYFVGDREVPENSIIISKYISCLECDSVFKIDDKDYTKDFLLEPVIAVGG